MRTFVRFYGARPLHLLAVVFCAVIALAVVITAGPETFWNRSVWWQSIAVWFVGAAVAHDLVLFPLYALADRSVAAGLAAMRGRRTPREVAVSPLNYIRIPSLATLLTFLMFLPGIVRQGSDAFTAATGLTQQPYLGRWLVLVGVMFAVSAVAYAIRLGVHARRTR